MTYNSSSWTGRNHSSEKVNTRSAVLEILGCAMFAIVVTYFILG